MSEDELEPRIRARAHQLWLDAGQPEGRDKDHWEQARTLVAIEDDRTSLKPINETISEPLDIQDNLGELPGALTDQGDRAQLPLEDVAKPPAPQAPPNGRRPSKSRK